MQSKEYGRQKNRETDSREGFVPARLHGMSALVMLVYFADLLCLRMISAILGRYSASLMALILEISVVMAFFMSSIFTSFPPVACVFSSASCSVSSSAVMYR